MISIRTGLRGLAVLGFLCFMAGRADAQASRTWVSGVGDDANPCSRTAPCKTFAGAISKTAVNGEINCLDPGGYGAVTITKSITIDCHEIYASILHSLTTGTIINFDAFAATDVRRTVRLRNLNYNGFDNGITGIRIVGGTLSAGSEVFIEDCLLDGNFGTTARGINDIRSGGGELSISNTTVRNMGQTGIVVLPATGSTRIDATFDNVRVQNANFGVAVGGSTKLAINRSVFSGNTLAGVEAEATAEVNVSNSVMSNNGQGVQVLGSAIVRLGNNDITLNGTALSGPTSSYGNNRLLGNPIGTAPTPIAEQ